MVLRVGAQIHLVMDYEKKYKEALGWMREMYPCLYGQFREDAERFFPELKESGDEWFIKELQGFLESYGADYFGTDEWQKFHAWLENQKDIEDRWIEDRGQCFWDGVEEGKMLAEKQKEQKPAEWSDEDEKIRRNLMSLLVNMRGDRITEETYQKYYPWLKSLRPSWKPNEEQMQYLLAVINDPNNAGAESCHLILESLYEQLKSIQ